MNTQEHRPPNPRTAQPRRRGAIPALLASLALAAAPLAASASVGPGTVLIGTIDKNLSSNHAYVGEQFHIDHVRSSDNDITGARILGHVSDVVPAGQGRPGKIRLSYDRLYTRSGSDYDLEARTASVQAITKSNAGREVGATAIGALVGGLLGHGLGAVLGGAGGYMIGHNARENVNISAGSVVKVQVLRAYRQTRRT